MPTRVRPIASVLLYDAGQGDPYVVDRGFAWYDLLSESARYGSFSRDSGGQPLVEFLPEIGVTLRPFLIQQDTRIGHFSTSGGSWEEGISLATGTQKYRLMQVDTAAGVEWSATSVYSLPEDPHVAFSLLLAEIPSDWNSATYPPYVRIELGNAEWAIELNQNGAFLLRRVSGAYQVALELPLPSVGGGYGQSQAEQLILVRCYRGRIGVSMDGGRSYTWHVSPDGSALAVAASKMTLRGRGGMAIFGVHQLRYYSGTYTSQQRNTFTPRLLAVPTLTSRSDAPFGSSVTLADASDGSAAIARYTATLVPGIQTASPFWFYRPPALYAVTFRYPVATLGGAGTYTTPWDTRLLAIDIDRPFELGAATATIRIKLDAGVALASNYRKRKIRVRLGWRLSDGSDEWHTRFTGYINTFETAWDSYGGGVLTITADNAAAPFRETEWTLLDVLPLGAQTVNAAADYILSTEGRGAAYRSWHAYGGVVPLPAGLPERPFELIKPRETKWETLTRLFGYAGLELAVSNDGVLLSGPVGYVSGTTHTYRARDTASLDEMVLKLGNRIDYGESATAALVSGTAESGELLMAWAADGTAEGNTASERFAPWRKVIQEELPDTTTPGMLIGRTQALATEHFVVKQNADTELYADFDVVRRDRVLLYGCGEVGIPDGTAHVVLTLRDAWTIDPERGEITLRTTAGLRRL